MYKLEDIENCKKLFDDTYTLIELSEKTGMLNYSEMSKGSIVVETFAELYIRFGCGRNNRRK